MPILESADVHEQRFGKAAVVEDAFRVLKRLQ
jgi:hypothetical protein